MYAYHTSLPYRSMGAIHVSNSLNAVGIEISLRGGLDFGAKRASVALVCAPGKRHTFSFLSIYFKFPFVVVGLEKIQIMLEHLFFSRQVDK